MICRICKQQMDVFYVGDTATCTECYAARTVNGYNMKPSVDGRCLEGALKPQLVGIELEMSTAHRVYCGLSPQLEDLHDAFMALGITERTPYWVKSDGSFTRGIEFVFTPMAVDRLDVVLHAFMPLLREHVPSVRAARGGGLHVHISPRWHIERVELWQQCYQLSHLIKACGGRQTNRYCRFQSAQIRGTLHKYQAIRSTTWGTTEHRYPNNSLMPKRLMERIVFAVWLHRKLANGKFDVGPEETLDHVFIEKLAIDSFVDPTGYLEASYWRAAKRYFGDRKGAAEYRDELISDVKKNLWNNERSD